MSNFVYSQPYDQDLPRWAANTTSLPIRISNYNNIATHVSQKLINTWKSAGLPTQSVDGKEYLGNASLSHGISLAIPEALPERIPSAVKLLDLICVLDTNQDVQDSQNGHLSWRAKRAMIKIASSALLQNASSSSADIAKTAFLYARSLKSFSSVLPATQHIFAELFPIRLYDFPCSVIMPGLAFVLGLKLSAADAASLQRLNVMATAAMALSNDLLSWPKETVERRLSNSEPCSSMTIFLRQRGCDEREALLRCRRKLIQFETKAALLADDLLASSCMSQTVKAMAQSYLLLIPGFATWQCMCGRFSSKGPVADLVREVLEDTLPLVALDDAFEQECENIVQRYLSIYRKYFK